MTAQNWYSNVILLICYPGFLYKLIGSLKGMIYNELYSANGVSDSPILV